MDEPLLITIPISHYCEKARWALERARVPYRERRHVQGVHVLASRRAGGRGTVPVLVTRDRVLAESADILAYADRLAPAERRIYPDDLRDAARALERELDAGLGPDGRRWLYHELRGARRVVDVYNPAGVPAWERAAMRLAYPAIATFIDRRLAITPARAARSLAAVRACFDDVAARLADGRPFLLGERFTGADLTFAALSAAIVMPPGYGVPLPGPSELPAAMAAVVRELREHPAGRHALALYREERR